MPSSSGWSGAVLVALGSFTGAGSCLAQEPKPIAGDTGLLREEADGIAFDASARMRVEYPDRKLVDLPQREESLGLFRLLGSIDAQAGALAGFVQVGAHQSVRDRGNPVENNGLDVQQAFVDFTPQRVGSEQLTRIRVGRSEMAYEFIALRDAPNVRRSWDGARVTLIRRGLTTNLFAVNAVQPKTGEFDDSSTDAPRLLGAHVRLAEGVARIWGSAWFYSARQEDVAFLAGTANADTRFAGIVLETKLGNVEASVGGGRQGGRFGGMPIRAHYVEGEIGYRWSKQKTPAFAALRYSSFSGGRSDGDVLRTFNPLFPNYAYSTEAALQSPSNLTKAGLLIEVELPAGLKLEYRGEGLWRYSALDAFYTPVGTPFITPDGSADRSLAIQQQFKATWEATPQLTLSGAVVHFAPDSFLRRAGLRAGYFGMVQLEAKF